MMIKLLTSGGDFDRALQHRRRIAFGLMALGILGILCYFTLIDGSDLPDMARGFYLGASCGIALFSACFLIRIQYLISHPEARKKAKVEETDERSKAIAAHAFQSAGLITLFLCAGALFILVIFSRPAALAVFFVTVAYAVAMLLARVYYSHRL